jgi:hypothetical protein
MLQPRRSRRPHIHHRVMHVFWHSRQNLRPFYPPSFLEIRRNNFVCVIHFSVRRNQRALCHPHDQIRLRNRPSPRPISLRRCIRRISRRRARLRPSRQCGNLLREQRRIIRKLPNPRFRKPRRHRPLLRRRTDRRRIRPRSVIRFKRHRRNPGRPMTHLAMPLQNRQHLAIKRNLRIRFCLFL